MKAALLALAASVLALQPPKQKPELPPRPTIKQEDREKLMSLTDVLGVAALSSASDWAAAFYTKKTHPVSNTSALQTLYGMSDARSRPPSRQRNGDIAEYDLLKKFRPGIEKTFNAAANFSASSPVSYFADNENFRFASSSGKTVGILIATTKDRLNKSKLDEHARAAKAVNDYAMPLTESFTDFAKGPAPDYLGILVAYGIQSSDDPKTTQPFGESIALIWESKSLTDLKAGTITRQQFIDRAQIYSSPIGTFDLKKITLKP